MGTQMPFICLWIKRSNKGNGTLTNRQALVAWSDSPERSTNWALNYEKLP